MNTGFISKPLLCFKVSYEFIKACSFVTAHFMAPAISFTYIAIFAQINATFSAKTFFKRSFSTVAWS